MKTNSPERAVALSPSPETIVTRLKAVEAAVQDVVEPCYALATLLNQDDHAYEPDPNWMIGLSTIIRDLADAGLHQVSELNSIWRELEDEEGLLISDHRPTAGQTEDAQLDPGTR